MSAKKRALAEIITITAIFVALIFIGIAFVELICNNGLEKYSFIAEFGVYILDIISVILVVKLFRDPHKNLGFSREKKITQLMWSVPLLIGMFAIYKIFGNSVQGSGFAFNTEALYHLFCFLLVASAEELIFRGLILSKLMELTENKIISIAISSLMFGTAHFMMGDIILILMSAVVGALLATAIVRIKNCTLVSTILAHWLYNYLMMYISI